MDTDRWPLFSSVDAPPPSGYCPMIGDAVGAGLPKGPQLGRSYLSQPDVEDRLVRRIALIRRSPPLGFG